jgi:hypothetical protein
MDLGDIIAIVAPVVSGVGVFFAVRRGQRQDDSSAAREMGVLLTEIGYVKSSLDGVVRKLDTTEARYVELAKQLSGIEASVKSAHRRLDDMTGGR